VLKVYLYQRDRDHIDYIVGQIINKYDFDLNSIESNDNLTLALKTKTNLLRVIR
jgi:hypothetical protein